MKFIVLFFLLLGFYSNIGIAGRSMRVLFNPHTAAWYDQEKESMWVECSVSNLSQQIQRLRITSHSGRNAPLDMLSKGSQTGSCTFNSKCQFVHGNTGKSSAEVQLDKNGSTYSFFWKITKASPSHLYIPKFIDIDVLEDRGAILGSCTLWWGNSSRSAMAAVPINGGRPF